MERTERPCFTFPSTLPLTIDDEFVFVNKAECTLGFTLGVNHDYAHKRNVHYIYYIAITPS